MTKNEKALIVLAISILVLLVSGVVFPITSGSDPVEVVDAARVDFITSKCEGVCYGPFRDREDPDCGILPTGDELLEDILFISKLSHSIRTYSIADSLREIPAFCQQAGIDCYPGAWISRYKCENEKEIQSLVQVANQNLSCIRALIVGNEVLFRRDISKEELIEYIERTKNSTALEVGTAELLSVWLMHPELAQSVDFILVHIHPYWDGIAADQAAKYVVEKWEELKAYYPGKPIIIGETGWPTQGEKRGEAIPSEENQRTFLSDFLKLVNDNDIPYFYFEVFDEKWKEKFEGMVGAHWGLYYSDGSLKPLLEGLVPEEAQEGINRPPRETTVTEAALPLPIYIDGCSAENSFCPSGWMGELAGWVGDPATGDSARAGEVYEVLDEACTESPHSGESCTRITYFPSPGEWGGIYWQYPRNNWGDYPGYDISTATVGSSKAVRLTFCARGKKGGEKAEFKTGGIGSFEKPYHDSFGPISTGVITLTKEWEEYFIPLEDQDLSMVIGGFCWVTNWSQNPDGCTIYLDDIQFELEDSTTEVKEGKSFLPQPELQFHLHQNYPNPFSVNTVIGYSVLKKSHVKLTIHNMIGQEIETLMNGIQPPGTYSIIWNGKDKKNNSVSTGVYLCRLASEGFSQVRRILILK